MQLPVQLVPSAIVAKAYRVQARQLIVIAQSLPWLTFVIALQVVVDCNSILIFITYYLISF